MWREALACSIALLCASACVQILGDDFEIGLGSGGNGTGGVGTGATSAGGGGAGDGGMAAGGGVANPELTVTLEGSGTGRVVSTPAGIDCPTTCTATFAAGASVTLTAEADPDTAFLGWSDGCTGDAACSVTMGMDVDVETSFELHGARRWLHHVNNAGSDRLIDTALDPTGNVVVAGTVETGGNDLYVAKLSTVDGTPVWEKTFATADVGENGGSVAVDAEGNVYVGVWLQGFGTNDTIEGFTVSGDLFGNVVVMRLAADTGAVEWLEEWGGSGQDRPHGIAVAGDDVYIAGETSSTTATFGSFTLAGSSGDAFLIRVNRANGTVLNAREFEGNNDVFGIAAGGGDVLVVGHYRAATTIDAGVNLPSSDGATDGMVIAFDGATLNAQWAQTFGDTEDDVAYAAAPFPGGGFLVTGSFRGFVLFASSGTSLASNGGSTDAFAVRYDADGNHVWSFRYGGPDSDIGRSIAVTPTGEAVMIGEFTGTITFGTHTLTGTGAAWDMFVTRMSSDAAPVHEWAVGLGGDVNDFAQGVVVDAAGDAYVTGQFDGMTNIDGLALSSLAMDSWVASFVR